MTSSILLQTGTIRYFCLPLLDYHAGFPRSLSKPHGGGFDANDLQRRPISGDAAARNPAVWKELLGLNARPEKTEEQQSDYVHSQKRTPP